MTHPPIRPAVAWAAVGPDGRILLNTIRGRQAVAILAARDAVDPDAWHRPSWPQLRRDVWRVVRVEIRPAGSVPSCGRAGSAV